MRKFLLWPVLVALYWIGSDAYYMARPCTGMFSGLCGLTDIIIKGMIVESIIIYTFISLAVTKVKSRRKKQVTVSEYIFAGIVSAAIVFAGVLLSGLGLTVYLGNSFTYPGASYFAISAPFVVFPMYVMEWVTKLGL